LYVAIAREQHIVLALGLFYVFRLTVGQANSQ